jgi:hypothetical protein
MAVNARAIRKHFLVWLIAGVAIALACMLATAQGAAGKPFAMQLVVFFGIVGAGAWIGAACAEAAAALPDPSRAPLMNAPAILRSLPLGVALIVVAVAAAGAFNAAEFGVLAEAPPLLLVIYAAGRVRRAAS